MSRISVPQPQCGSANYPDVLCSDGAGPCFLVGCYNKALKRAYLLHDPKPDHGGMRDLINLIADDEPADTDLVFVVAGGVNEDEDDAAFYAEVTADGFELADAEEDGQAPEVFAGQDEMGDDEDPEAFEPHWALAHGAIFKGIAKHFPAAHIEEHPGKPGWIAGMEIDTSTGHFLVTLDLFIN